MSWFLSCVGCGNKYLPDKDEEKILDFQHCSLTALPFEVFNSERVLEELYLDANQITELGPSLFHCHGLRILSFSDNDVQFIPEAISSLKSLTSLNFSKNGVADIPDSIKNCKKIEYLNASTNPLCRLPESFTQLVGLKELSLNETFLEYLPANFGRLSGLEVLDLRENQLNSLPLSMSRLCSLKRIDLGQNEFFDVPEVIGYLTNLTDLWIDNNKISHLPSEIGKLPNLAFLDASKNQIETIAPTIGNCKKLMDLYLNHNIIQNLPDELCDCISLRHLHIDNNDIAYIPENLGYLERLIEINMCNNRLVSFPSSCGLMRSLKILHLDYNKLDSLPSDIGSCVDLVIMTASNNHITFLPAELGNLSRLRVINVCRNKLTNLPVSFTKLELTALWLSENQTKALVPLQSIVNHGTGHKVLTCYMLPQEPYKDDFLKDSEEDIDIPENRKQRNSIHFASENLHDKPGSLSRTPTPYPKELRALARHTRNQALKKCPTFEQVDSLKKPEEISYSKSSTIAMNRTSQENSEVRRSKEAEATLNNFNSYEEGKFYKNSSRPASIAAPEVLTDSFVSPMPAAVPISKRPMSLAVFSTDPNTPTYTNYTSSQVSQSCTNINSFKKAPNHVLPFTLQSGSAKNKSSSICRIAPIQESDLPLEKRSLVENNLEEKSKALYLDRLDSDSQEKDDSGLVSIINKVTDELNDESRPLLNLLENSAASEELEKEEGKQPLILNEEDSQPAFSMGHPSNQPVKIGQLTSPSKVKLQLLANDISEPMNDFPSKIKPVHHVPYEVQQSSPVSPGVSSTNANTKVGSKIPQMRSPSVDLPQTIPSINPRGDLSTPSKKEIEDEEFIPLEADNKKNSASALSRIPRFVSPSNSTHSKGKDAAEQQTPSKIPSLLPKAPLQSPAFQSPSGPAKDNPTLQSSWKPSSGKELSPIEKPINTTGIPLPSGSSSEKQRKSRSSFGIPKYSGNSTVVPSSAPPSGSSVEMKSAWMHSQ